jgi:glycosyltransferase involved in cell wall biosynthesis
METEIIKNRDFIVFGLQPWDISIGSNCKNIALEIAKHNNVLYVNRPLDRISSWKNKNNLQTKNRIESVKQGKNILIKEQENLTVFNPRVILNSINFLPEGKLYKIFNKRNNKTLAKEILWAANELNFKNPILFIDNDFFNGQYLKAYLKPSFFVYYIRDFLLSQHYFKKHGYSAEPSMIKKADAVATNSKYLKSYAEKYNPVAADVGQGCEVDIFLKAPTVIPDDIKAIKSPKIGYCGSLTATRLDILLIEFIALQKPEWNIVLVGPEDEAFKNSTLHSLQNIFFLGSKAEYELPAYVHAFDVCINPQLLNQMTIGNYPRKVDEYLAAGKPVVATKTEAMDMFAEQTYLCIDKEDYIAKIILALAESIDNEKKLNRSKLAQSHTWQASVNKIYTLINKNLNDAEN